MSQVLGSVFWLVKSSVGFQLVLESSEQISLLFTFLDFQDETS